MNRIATWLLRLTAGFAALLILFHGVENWRGQRAWEAWKRSRMALGDRFAWPEPPPPVPDEENFAAVPEIARTVRTDGASFRTNLQVPDRVQAGRGWRHGEHEDLGAWARALKAQDLTSALAPAAQPLDILASASRRPKCRLPYDLRKGELPMLLGFRNAGKILRLRALDHLAHGRASEAREDVVTLLRTAKHLESDPTLISALLNTALLQQALQPLWEGIADHRWREEDLRILEEELSGPDLITAFDRAWETERMWVIGPEPQSLEALAESPFWARGEALLAMSTEQTGTDWRRHLLGLAVPRGWIHQNLLARDRFWVEQMKPCLDPRNHRYFADRTRAASSAMESSAAKGWRPYRWLVDLSFPALLGQNLKAALAQTGLDQARTACALERYRLARGTYPESLEALVPAFLDCVPTDIPAGGSLHYRREGQGYVIWSVGVDGKDEGGRTVDHGANPTGIDPDRGDWVWRSPGK